MNAWLRIEKAQKVFAFIFVLVLCFVFLDHKYQKLPTRKFQKEEFSHVILEVNSTRAKTFWLFLVLNCLYLEQYLVSRRGLI